VSEGVSHCGRWGSELLRRREDSSWISCRPVGGATCATEVDEGVRRILTLALLRSATGFRRSCRGLCVGTVGFVEGGCCGGEGGEVEDEDDAAAADGLYREMRSGSGSLCSLLRFIIRIRCGAPTRCWRLSRVYGEGIVDNWGFKIW
jgi:hypothetical protein